jgi:hypothetical protein
MAGSGSGASAELTHNSISPQMMAMIEKFVSDNQMEFGHMSESLKKATIFKYKEIISETLAENNRRGSFVRIFPAKGAEAYDQYFHSARPLNKLMQRVLYGDEIIPLNKSVPAPSHNNFMVTNK